jgi:3-oxo-5alpha-steroid 4-dehydrogenase
VLQGNVDAHHWDYTVDVAVVGLGAAGASAAIEARDHGASVCVVERFNGGGSSAISGGIVYAGGGTFIQQEAGIADTPEDMFDYLRQETGDAVTEATLQRFCRESAANLLWLQRLGVPFEASLCPFKTSYPSNDYYFYFSGNEAFLPYSNHARPAPRGHRTLGRGVSGAVLYGPMRDAAIDRGVSLLSQHRALGLIVDDDGHVVGLQMRRLPPHSLARWVHRQLYRLLIFARYAAMYAPPITYLLRAALEFLENRFGQEIALRARRGIVISTGGFFFNREMVKQHAPNHLSGMPLGTIGDDGAGILMGRSLGARTRLMYNVSQWRFINPPESFVRGIMIDSQGRRIGNEMLYGAQLNEQIMAKADGQAWLLIDARLFKKALKEIGPRRAMWFQSAAALMYLYLARRKAGTLAELAHKLAIPTESLAATVEAYNTLAASGGPDPLGKPGDYLQVLDAGPWYALDCRVDGAVRNPSLTLGGLCVDEESGEVLAEDGGVIQGLYAAGRAAVGIASHSYVSGLSIADCIFAGRRAGRHAAAADRERR